MQILADLEDVLALFAEGIAGRYFHIKATDEFANHRRLSLGKDGVGQSSDTLFLPEQLDAPDPSGYRVLVMEQLGQRECDSFGFRMQHALATIPELADRHSPPRSQTPRSGDFFLLFGTFAQPGLAADILNLLERGRVLAHLRRHYPGLQPHLSRYHTHLLRIGAGTTDALACGTRYLFGDKQNMGQWGIVASALSSLEAPDSTVYDSVTWLCRMYDQIEASYVFTANGPYEPQDESLPDWLNREQRIDEWEENLEGLEMAMAVEMLESEDVEAERGDIDQPSVRDMDADLKSLREERDTLKRRIDMEKSAVAQALGADRSGTRSYRYDEWDYQGRRYLKHWCRVFEEPLGTDPSTTTDSEAEVSALQEVIRRYRPMVQKQLQQIRPTGLQRVSRVQDGDELDLNAIIEARQDIRAGHSPDERFYSRKERLHRDVSALFLVDLSASTDDPIEPPEPRDWSGFEDDDTANLRDPWNDDFDAEPVDDTPKRKIIDVQREAMVVMASALDALGDNYAIYGFSGYGKDCVEFFVAKEADQSFSNQTLKAIAAMKPKRSTRMGPAIRHSTHRLNQTGHAMKVLIVVSDGFPQDSDYGPDRGNHDYGVEDTAKALREAQQKGIETFCITVDRSGQDYLKRMCPDSRYLVIEDMEDLPDQLSKVYATLTSR